MRNHALELLQTASNLVDHSDKRQDCFSRQLQRQRHHHASVDYLERPARVCPGDRDGEIAEFAARARALAGDGVCPRRRCVCRAIIAFISFGVREARSERPRAAAYHTRQRDDFPPVLAPVSRGKP